MVEYSRSILYSENKEALGPFLAEMLEMDMKKDKDGILLEKESLTFLIKEGESGVPNTPGPAFEFRVNDRADLDEIINKVQFIEYRLKDSKRVVKNANSLIEDKDESYFLATDPDGRVWKFSYRHS